MTNPTILYPVKMEYGWNFSISALKMMVKRGRVWKKYFWNSSMGKPFPIKRIYLIERRSFDQKYKFSNKKDMVWNFKNIFSRPHFTIIFRREMLKFHPYSIWPGKQWSDCQLQPYTLIKNELNQIVKRQECFKSQSYQMTSV